MRQRAVAALSETGATFSVALEGVRKSWDVRHWWREYVLHPGAVLHERVPDLHAVVAVQHHHTDIDALNNGQQPVKLVQINGIRHGSGHQVGEFLGQPLDRVFREQ